MGLPSQDLPPTYTEATTITASSPPYPSPSTTNPSTGLPFDSPLTTHLRTLPSRLRANQQAHKTLQAAHDSELTAQIIPHIEAFLADLTSLPRVPPVAELTLVPASAVPVGSALSGAAERRREGEVVRVARVDVEHVVFDDGFSTREEKGKRGVVSDGGDADGDGDGRRVREVGFDEWGRFDTDGNDKSAKGGGEKGWWFTDEEMARRLAVYLRPEPDLGRKRVQAAVVEQKKVVKEEKSVWGKLGFGSGKGKKAAEQPSPLVPTVSPGPASPRPAGEDDSVRMTVRAEEVTFRWENDFGVWEGKTGWGILVDVRVKP